MEAAQAKIEIELDKKRQKQVRHYADIGPPCGDADYKPRISGNPEESLAAAFRKLGKDYGGALPADFVLHAVLTHRRGIGRPRHPSIEATAEAE